MKHTPGPWTIEADHYAAGQYVEPTIWGPLNEHTGMKSHVAVIRIGLKESEANARLIAAAPDLMEACKSVVAWFKDLQGKQERLLILGQSLETVTENWDEATLGHMFDIAPIETAIKKAEAES